MEVVHEGREKRSLFTDSAVGITMEEIVLYRGPFITDVRIYGLQ